MVLGGNPRRVVGAAVVVLLLAGLMAFHVAERAGAREARCRAHRIDALDRAAVARGLDARTVVLGDSWSVGLGLDDLGDSWPSRLGTPARVAGFSGSGFSHGASGCARVSFADRAAAAVRGGADLVVVEGGLNDFDQTDASVTLGFARLMRVLDGHRVVVVGPARAPSRADAVPRVDRLLARLSAAYEVPYVATSDLDLPYLHDGLHLTAAGHAAFGDAVRERIAEVLPEAPTPPSTTSPTTPPTPRRPAREGAGS